MTSTKIRTILFTMVVAFLFTGCSCKKTTVILLSDHDNNVGQVKITNAHGSIVLDQANHGVSLRKQYRPKHTVAIAENKIKDRFGSVLAVEPELPAKFILYFKNGSDVLTNKSLARIPDIVNEIKQRSSMDISVAGHCDRMGNEDVNIALSLKRSHRVLNILLDQGIDSQFIQTSSHGEGNPLIFTPDNVAEPRNRRVEVIVK